MLYDLLALCGSFTLCHPLLHLWILGFHRSMDGALHMAPNAFYQSFYSCMNSNVIVNSISSLDRASLTLYILNYTAELKILTSWELSGKEQRVTIVPILADNTDEAANQLGMKPPLRRRCFSQRN